MLSRSLALMMPLLLAPVAVACSVETASDDEAAEEALTRGTTIPEGSYLARGVLRVANELTAAQLRAAPLKVSATLSAAIVSRRGTAGFPTLAALDAISGTGPAFFDKLTAYAKANGYVGRCGDGRLETGLEACDDANADDTDGCDRTCAVVPVTGPRCGNGRVEGAEECDAATPACSGTCTWTVVKDYEQPGDHSTAAGAIELGSAMRRGQGRLESSNYLRPVDYWAFTLDRPARVQIDISGSLYGSPGCYSEIYGNGEVRSADGSLVYPFYPNGMLANDFDKVLPAGRYFFSVVGDYTRCTIGGSEYVGGWYGVKLDVTP